MNSVRLRESNRENKLLPNRTYESFLNISLLCMKEEEVTVEAVTVPLRTLICKIPQTDNQHTDVRL